MIWKRFNIITNGFVFHFLIPGLTEHIKKSFRAFAKTSEFVLWWNDDPYSHDDRRWLNDHAFVSLLVIWSIKPNSTTQGQMTCWCVNKDHFCGLYFVFNRTITTIILLRPVDTQTIAQIWISCATNYNNNWLLTFMNNNRKYVLILI